MKRLVLGRDEFFEVALALCDSLWLRGIFYEADFSLLRPEHFAVHKAFKSALYKKYRVVYINKPAACFHSHAGPPALVIKHIVLTYLHCF